MGPKDIGFFMKDGTKIRLDYKSSETPWSSIREWFPTIEERQLEHFIEKGIDNKLITLFNKLCSIENKIDSLSIKKIKMEVKNNGTE